MAEIVIIGGGLTGQAAAMLLAADGHRVRVLERDPAPPAASAAEAWESWERRGVNQFRLLHYFLARFRRDRRGGAARGRGGARRGRRAADEPARGNAGGDERWPARRRRRGSRCSTGRRPVVEAAIGRVAARTPGVDVRRGVAVKGLLTGDAQAEGVPHVVGRGHRGRRRAACRSGGRRRRPALGTPPSPRRHRCPPSRRRSRGFWFRLLRPPLPLRRRFGATGVRAT